MIRRNSTLHAKLDKQINGYQAQHGHMPASVWLTHDEIDEWRSQFDIVIPVGSLAYRGVPIREEAMCNHAVYPVGCEIGGGK